MGVGVLLSAWPDVDLASMSALELLEAIENGSNSATSEKFCLGSVAAAERVKRYLDASQAQWLCWAAGLAARGMPSSGSYDAVNGIELTGSEIALSLGLSPRAAMDRVGDSIQICEDLPAILALVRAGKLDWRTAVAVNAQMRQSLQPGTPAWNAVQDSLAARLAGKTQHQATDAARRAILKADPEGARERREAKKKERCVHVYPLSEGMGGLDAVLSADDAMLIHSVLDTLADACRDYSRRAGTPDPRNHQQRRADAFVSIFRAIHHHTPLPFVPTPSDPTGTFSGRTVPSDHPDAPAATHQPPSSPASPPNPATSSTASPSSGASSSSGVSSSSGALPSSGASGSPGMPLPTGASASHSAPAAPGSAASPGMSASSGTSPSPGASASPGASNPPNTPAPTDASGSSDVPGSFGSPILTESCVLGWWLPPSLPTQQGRKPHLLVTVSLNTLRRKDDVPGELSRIGAISADMARELARQSDRLLLIPINDTSNGDTSNGATSNGDTSNGDSGDDGSRASNGTSSDGDSAGADNGAGDGASVGNGAGSSVGDVSARERVHGPGDQAHCPEPSPRYKPRQSVIDKVLARFQQCVHPGCRRDAAQCDIDHAIPFAKGGKSCPCNLVPLCRRHHRLKTHAGWALRLTRPDEPYPEGSIEWRSRLCQHHIEIPEPLPGEPDHATRDQIRQQEWQQELHRINPNSRPHISPESAVPEPLGGEPLF